MFMFFHYEYYFTMLKRIWNKKDWPGRNALLFRLLIIVPLTHLFHSLFFFLDKVFFPGLWTQNIEKPIFIIGHARSGTTLMHRLMAADSDRFSYFLYWEMFFPSLIQRKLIRGFAALDRAVLHGYFYNKAKAWDEKTFGPYRHMHNMGLWIAEEDDFVNATTFHAAYWQLQAPMMDTLDVFYLDRKLAKRRAQIMNHYKECIKRQLYMNGGNKIHLSKNPVYSGRVESLIEAFPDARIVVMMRNPLECVTSNIKLMEGNYKSKRWQKEDYAESLKILETMSYDCYRLPKQALENNPDVPALVVDYRQLTAAPKQTVEEIYHTFGLPVEQGYSDLLDEKNANVKQHKTQHKYSTEEFGMDVEAMRGELAEFFDAYGWDKP